ncbi:MAG TPA: BON domain-containing protein [Chryseosolibacter sp.]
MSTGQEKFFEDYRTSRRSQQKPNKYITEGDRDRNWLNRAGDEVLSWLGDDYAQRRRRHDDASHRGKGPKNFKRSDDRIKEMINDALTDDWQVDASDIEVTVSNGEVILSGYVNDRDQKRKAEDLAESVSGVRHVENRIKINRPAPQGSLVM